MEKNTFKLQNKKVPSSGIVVETLSEKEPVRYGFGSWKPNFLQNLNNPKFLLFNFCIMVIVQGAIINGFISTSVTTLEKRFYLSSKMTGFLSVFYDIVVVFLLIPVSFYATQFHKIRIIAISITIMGIGSILFSMPQFFTSLYHSLNLNDSSQYTCLPKSAFTKLGKIDIFSYSIFLIAQGLHGIGCSALFTVTYVTLDENVSQKQSSIYTGILYGFSVFGPAIGYIIGGMALNLYGDFYRVSTPKGIDINNKNWYGAWWISFLVGGIILLISSVPAFGFGHHLPHYERIKNERISEAHGCNINEDCVKISFGRNLSELPKTMLRLCKNSTYVLLILCDSFDALLLNAFIIFAPKVMETQFNLSASKASILCGAALTPAGVTGTILSGYLIRNMNVKSKMKFGALMFIISIPFILAFLLNCPSTNIIGIHEKYKNSTSINLIDKCNSKCQCSVDYQEYICQYDNKTQQLYTYASPCFAGCSTSYSSSKDCACLDPTLPLMMKEECNKLVPSCRSLYPFLVMIFIVVFLTFMAATPTVQAIMRCVLFTERSIAVGLGWMVARIVGTIPGPILFGYMIDAACLTDNKRNCLYYDSQKLAKDIIIVGVTLRTVAFFLILIASLTYKSPKKHRIESDYTDSTDSDQENVIKPNKLN